MGVLAMTDIITKSFRSLFEPKIFKFIFVPFLVSLIALFLGVWLTFDFWLAFIRHGWSFVEPYSTAWIPQLLQNFLAFLGPFFHFLFFVSLIGLFFPLMIVINLGVTSFLASTKMVKTIAEKDYPQLVIKGYGRTAGSLWNLLWASFLYIFLWVITLPLWLVPGAQVLLPIMLTAGYNRRICTFDALTEFANDEEFNKLMHATKKRGFLTGIMTALINYIPFAFLISPVLTMIAFSHLALSELSLERQQKIK